jgi:putative membrane protein
VPPDGAETIVAQLGGAPMELETLTDALAGLGPFVVYIGLSLGLVAIYAAVYMLITAHDELRLVRAGNPAAATAFSGSLIGYTLPLAAAAGHSSTLMVFVVWGVIAIVVQVLIYWLVRLVFLADLSARIEKGELSAGLLLAGASLAGGIVDAAAMAA